MARGYVEEAAFIGSVVFSVFSIFSEPGVGGNDSNDGS